jgi:hypothetical protein
MRDPILCVYVRSYVHLSVNGQHAAMYQVLTHWELQYIDIGTKGHRQRRHSIVRLES